jgi:hypothetical protein
MSDPATEIAYLPLKANLDLESGEAKSAWDSTLATIAKQPGFQTLFWGRQVENKDILQLVVGMFCHTLSPFLKLALYQWT